MQTGGLLGVVAMLGTATGLGGIGLACGSSDGGISVDASATADAAQNDAALATAFGFDNESSRIPFNHRGVGFDGDGLAGAGWLDYDADGDLDLFLVNGKGHDNGLFRNNGDGTFTDVATAAGVNNGAGNAGVAIADIDNDGYPDLFVTGDGSLLSTTYSGTRLYRNNGDGTFTDITQTAGVVGAQTAGGAAFADINNDGYVDLYVTALGGLAMQQNHASTMYLNNGDNTFTDISASSGVNTSHGACSVGFSDFDGDGFVDLLVGNCNNVGFATTPLELFHNNGDNTFTDIAASSGLGSLSGYWMGIALGDFDNDGDIDAHVTNFGTSIQQDHILLVNDGTGSFTEQGAAAGIAAYEFGWGTVLADFDNDGDMDMYYTGAIPIGPFNIRGTGVACPGRLFLNKGDGSFAAPVVPVNTEWLYTSGVAKGDFDNDGFVDIIVAIAEVPDLAPPSPGQPMLLRNTGNSNTSITVRLVGTTSNRSAIGARIEAITPDLHQIREVRGGSSAYSQNSPWPSFGLAQNTRVQLIVHWPSGLSEDFGEFDTKQLVTLQEGQGTTP